MYIQYGLRALVLPCLILAGCVTRYNDDGTQSRGVNWYGIAAGMQAAGAAHNGNYNVPQQYQQVPQGSAFNSATIIRPGRAPSYYSGDNFGGVAYYPRATSFSVLSRWYGRYDDHHPGQPPVYIQQH